MKVVISRWFSIFFCAFCLFLAACSSPNEDLVSDSEVRALTGEQPLGGKSTPEAATTSRAAQYAAADHIDGFDHPFAELLSFVPASFADVHLPATFGPVLYLLNVEQMRNDLGISPVIGSSDYQQKVDLAIALGEATQGLSIYPSNVFPTTSDSFDEWGVGFRRC